MQVSKLTLRELLQDVANGLDPQEAMQSLEESAADEYEALCEAAALDQDPDQWASEDDYWASQGLGDHDFGVSYNDAGEPLGYM